MKEIIDRLSKIEQRMDRLEAMIASRPGAANTVVLDKEMDRIIQKMDTIASTYAGHQAWRASDLALYREMRERLKEIKRTLNIKY